MKTQTLLNLNGVPTTVMTWGKGLPEVKSNKEVQDLVLVIPGNPGYIPLYEEFIDEIHNRLGVPVWIVGHAGHEPEGLEKFPPLAGNELLYDTNGQIAHKQAFIDNYVPDNVRLHLVGHSIGPYIILQLLKVPSIRKRVVGTYNLFPTIERMAESPKGKSFVATMKFQRLILLLLQIFTLVPKFFQVLALETLGSLSERYASIYANVLDTNMIRKMFLMGDHEMILVKERDTETLRTNKNIVKLYYGANDGWTPKSYYTELLQDVPGIDVEISSQNIKHSFLSRQSKEVAGLVAGWIKKKTL